MNLPNQEYISTNWQFIQPQLISHHLYCSICHCIFKDPVRTSCYHTFCYLCIQKWVYKNKLCPLCKISFTKRKLQKDLIAFNIVDDLMVKCLYKNCQWKGKYLQIKKHHGICQYRQKKNIILNINSQQIENIDIIQIINLQQGKTIEQALDIQQL